MSISPPTAACAAAGGGGQFGDTTYTKVFVGGLAWETQKDTLRNYFLQFGDILEAVVITDKATSRSKGYGFVTFREAEAAMRACIDPSPVIDGRRANCNLAFLGAQKSKPSTPSHFPHHIHGTSVNVKGMNNRESGYGGGGGGGGAAFIGTTTASGNAFPHFAVQQGIPLAPYYGYPPYSSDYSYPTGYYGVHGGATAQYQMYGSAGAGAGGGMMSCFYPYSLQFGDQANAPTSYTTGAMQSYGVPYANHPYQFSTAAYPYQHYSAPMSFASATNPIHSGMSMALQAPIPHC